MPDEVIHPDVGAGAAPALPAAGLGISDNPMRRVGQTVPNIPCRRHR
ncbi:hypothetical protein MMEU_2123 [Mycobacterium marinum str. Europe]|nr:hypothetical protein MMEU_2123 [Mycobacterium marinum str. Europe]